jgi:nicotinate phosphoribosyltransferase
MSGPGPASTGLYTDHYELTMLDASLQAGTAGHRVTFEVFVRRLPPGRGYGVFGGLGRLVDSIERFTFGRPELDWLASKGIVSEATLDWLASYRFSGNVWAYREGELYTAGSPVVTVEGTFGQAVLLETLVLSVLNHDSAVAAAADRIVIAARGRPVIEMGSRRTDPEAAVAAARVAWIAGFASTSNLEAGRRYGIPTSGTAAHAFTLAFGDERAAFAAQVAAQGLNTTLLVDTYDTEQGIRNAVATAGPGLGAVRIDSGDLVDEAHRARKLLDDLGATSTRVVITGDLDEQALDQLASAPVDGYGVGTSVVTGAGFPTAGFVYKMVSAAATDDPAAPQAPAAKRSPGKGTRPCRKWAWRLLDGDTAVGEEVAVDPNPPPGPARPVQIPVIQDGQVVHRETPADARRHLQQARAELSPGTELPLIVRRPA